MAGVRRPAILGATAALVAATIAPVSTVATDEVTQIVPGYTSLAHAFDLDGDGARELIRIGSDEARGPLELEVWAIDGSAWRPTASHRLERAFEDRGPITPETPLAMVEWRHGREVHLLLAVGNGMRFDGGVDKFSLALVTRRGTQLALWPLVLDEEGPIERIEAADLDADGIDELVIAEPGVARSGETQNVRLLRWDGERFGSERVPVSDEAFIGQPIVGESDGVPGVDLIFASYDRAELFRVTGAGPATVERAELVLDSGPLLVAWPEVVAGGTIYLHTESGGGMPAMIGITWPAGESPVLDRVVQEDASGFRQPVWIGERLFFLDDPSWRSPAGAVVDATLFDEEGGHVAVLQASPALERSRRWVEAAGLNTGFGQPFPYSGPLPGGIGDATAWIIGGNLIVAGGNDQVDVRPTSGFVGTAPIGLVGPDEGWMALTIAAPFGMAAGYLHPAFPMEDAVTIAPAKAVFEAETAAGALEVHFEGATRISDANDSWVASPDGGFGVIVEGPPGARVAAVVGSVVAASDTIGATGRVELRLDPRPRRDDTVEYTAGVVRVSPTGHVHVTEWRGQVLREPPTLEAEAETRTGALEAVVRGRSEPHATVTVDGVAAPVEVGGAFSLAVEAGLVPRDVAVQAVDPAGNETTQRLEVVGMVDYRGWPWVPIVGMATILFGAGMYLRAPRGRSLADVRRDDGTIEEIDAG